MSLLALSDSFEYLCYGSTVIINIFTASLSDIYGGKILVYKDSLHAESDACGPRAKRVKLLP